MDPWDAILRKVDELLSADMPKDSPEFQKRVDQAIDEILKINHLRGEKDLATLESSLKTLFEKGLSYEKNRKLFPEVRLDDPNPVINEFWRLHMHPDYQRGGYLHNDVVYASPNLNTAHYLSAVKWIAGQTSPRGLPSKHQLLVRYELPPEEAAQIKFHPPYGPEEKKDWKEAGLTLKEVVEKVRKENKARDVFHASMTPEQLERHCFEILLPNSTPAEARYIATFENAEQIHKDLPLPSPLALKYGWVRGSFESKPAKENIRREILSHADQFRESDYDYGFKIARVPDSEKWVLLYARIAQLNPQMESFQNVRTTSKMLEALRPFATDEAVREIEALIPSAKKFEKDHEGLIQKCRDQYASIEQQTRNKGGVDEISFKEVGDHLDASFQELSEQPNFEAYQKTLKAQTMLRRYLSKGAGKKFEEFTLDRIRLAPQRIQDMERNLYAQKRRLRKKDPKPLSNPTPEDIKSWKHSHQQRRFPSSRRQISRLERRRAFRPPAKW